MSADSKGADLFIQVTALSGGTNSAPAYEWAVEVNNPTDQPVTSMLRQTHGAAGLDFGTQTVTLAPGEHKPAVPIGSADGPPERTTTATVDPPTGRSRSRR